MKAVGVLTVFLTLSVSVESYLPVVLWHGMGDSCCNPFSMGRIKSLIEEQHNGTYVYSIMVGDNVIADTENGFFMNVNDQIDFVCEKIKADPMLAGGFHSVGFSQGGQFLRALVQRCPSPATHNLVSVGGQHQGVFGVPPCDPQYSVCEYIRKLLHTAAYSRWVQDRLVQAEYWHDPLNETAYAEGSVFIAEINQEKEVKPSYRTNLYSVRNFVMVKFLNDTTVIPNESSWFGFYTPGQDVEVQSLQQSDLYTQDLLGLKQMEEEGRLHFLSTFGGHLQFSDSWFIDNIINNYLD